MKTYSFKIDSAKAQQSTKLWAVVMSVGFFPLLFWGLSALRGSRGGIGEWGETWWPAGLLFVIIGIGGLYYAHKNSRTRIELTHEPNAGMRISMYEPDGSVRMGNGVWTWHAHYGIITVRYGLKKKEGQLILYNKNKQFCVLRQDFMEFAQQPSPEFILLTEKIDITAPFYVTGNLNEIMHLVASAHGSERIAPKQNENDLEQIALRYAAQFRQPQKPQQRKEGTPEYGDPDYDL
jgi:hypothetical protein